MGDRAYCTLTILGDLPRSELEALSALLTTEAAHPTSITHSEHTPEQVLEASQNNAATRPQFGFDEVNYAEMPNDIRSFLVRTHLSWAWHWCSGADYGPGVEFCNTRRTISKQIRRYSTVDDNIVLPLDEAIQYAAVQEARDWSNWYKAATFRIAGKDSPTVRPYTIQVTFAAYNTKVVRLFAPDPDAAMLAAINDETEQFRSADHAGDTFVEAISEGHVVHPHHTPLEIPPRFREGGT